MSLLIDHFCRAMNYDDEDPPGQTRLVGEGPAACYFPPHISVEAG